jgi:hypothetical protein
VYFKPPHVVNGVPWLRDDRRDRRVDHDLAVAPLEVLQCIVRHVHVAPEVHVLERKEEKVDTSKVFYTAEDFLHQATISPSRIRQQHRFCPTVAKCLWCKRIQEGGPATSLHPRQELPFIVEVLLSCFVPTFRDEVRAGICEFL